MSLLTDEEINEARAPHIGLPLKCWPQHRAIADASQTVTLKAVAKEMDSRCPHFQKRRPKSDCPSCMVGLMTACLEGKMPGEEK